MLTNEFLDSQFFMQPTDEEQARILLWKQKFPEHFSCPFCHNSTYFEMASNLEVRRCKRCDTSVRLRVGTLFENSKLPLTKWFQAIHLVLEKQNKITAVRLKAELNLGAYCTAWSMLKKIRRHLSADKFSIQLRSSLRDKEVPSEIIH